MKERARVYTDSPQAIVNNHFSDIVIREDCWTVKVGAGLTWADAYKYLVPKGLNVVGGRLSGIGVAGLTPVGGECYSSSSSARPPWKLKRICVWQDKTNEYGLTVGSVTEFHLVLPNGTQTVVTGTDKDLWFALKVCLNDGDGWGCSELSHGIDQYYRVDSLATTIVIYRCLLRRSLNTNDDVMLTKES
jgi:hypothetical protein